MAEPSGLRVCDSSALLERGKGVQWDLRYCGLDERAFALRIDGRVVAYLNRCAHVPVELDWQPDEFLDAERRYIVCAIHGAVYSPTSGACVMGRCGRAGLVPVQVAEVEVNGKRELHWYPAGALQPLPVAADHEPRPSPQPDAAPDPEPGPDRAAGPDAATR